MQPRFFNGYSASPAQFQHSPAIMDFGADQPDALRSIGGYDTPALGRQQA